MATARDALEEVGQLVELLSTQLRSDDPPGVANGRRVLHRPNPAGLSVTNQLTGNCDLVAPASQMRIQ